jgi:hypothetical protein
MPEVVIAAALAVVAFIIRQRALPHEGLWHDDAVTALGAVKGSTSQLLIVSFDHPVFTLLLRALWPITGGSSSALAYPVFAAGVVGPSALYLVLRRFGFARSISVMLGAALVAVDIGIIYSGHVKTYTIDLLIVLGLTAIIPVLARKRWSSLGGLAWFAVSIALGSFSAFALVATAVAGVILVLHARGDRRLRAVAVAGQLATAILFLIALQRTYNAKDLRIQWQRNWDPFLTFDLNPIGLSAEILTHLRRVATVFPGGTGWWATVCVVAAMTGLIAIVRTGRHAIRARYLLLLVVVGIAGGVAHRLPFGPFGLGSRVTLWLVPVVAIGLAVVLKILRRLFSEYSLRIVFDLIAYAVAIVMMIVAFGRDTPPYPFAGSKSATEFINAQLRRTDAVFILPSGRYSYALESKFPVTLYSQPEETIGFVPKFADRRLNLLDDDFDSDAIAKQVRNALRRADRAFVHAAPGGGGAARYHYTLELLRRAEGWKVERSSLFGEVRVITWRKA